MLNNFLQQEMSLKAVRQIILTVQLGHFYYHIYYVVFYLP